MNLDVGHLSSFEIRIDHKIDKNTQEHACSLESNYKISQCFEKFVRESVGCASPWDLTSDPNVSMVMYSLFPLFRNNKHVLLKQIDCLF